jgi:hypothetical protein
MAHCSLRDLTKSKTRILTYDLIELVVNAALLRSLHRGSSEKLSLVFGR